MFCRAKRKERYFEISKSVATQHDNGNSKTMCYRKEKYLVTHTSWGTPHPHVENEGNIASVIFEWLFSIKESLLRHTWVQLGWEWYCHNIGVVHEASYVEEEPTTAICLCTVPNMLNWQTHLKIISTTLFPMKLRKAWELNMIHVM